MKKFNIALRHILILTPLILTMFQIFIYPSYASAEIVLIANKGISENSLSKEEIKRIFLGKKKKWQDNTPITIILRKRDDTHEELLKKYVQRSPKQFQNVWRRLVFTGEGQFPRSISNEGKLIDVVAKQKGAISYIDSAQLNNKVKIIHAE